MDNVTVDKMEGSSVGFIIFRTTFLFLLGGLIVAGNALSIAVTQRVQGLADSTKVLMTALAMYDFLAGVLTLFYSITSGLDSWPFGQLACAIISMVAGESLAMSIVCLTLLNIDRYIAVTRPLRFPVLCSKCRVIALVVIFSCSFCAFFLVNTFAFGITVSYNRFCALCLSPYNSWGHALIILCLWDIIPVLIIVVIYCRLIQISRRHMIFINQNRPQGADTDNSSKKALQAFLTITLLFAACWSPLLMSQVLSPALQTTVPVWVDFITNWLATANSFFNVFIYCLFNRSFRRTAKQIIQKRFCIRSTSVQPVID